MTEEQSQRHPLWQLARKKGSDNPQNPLVYRVRDNCKILISRDRELIVLLIKSEGEEVIEQKECFNLKPDGSSSLTVSAWIKSGLTQRIHVAMETAECSVEELTQKNIHGYNWMRDQLDVIVATLSDPRTTLVAPGEKANVEKKTDKDKRPLAVTTTPTTKIGGPKSNPWQ